MKKVILIANNKAGKGLAARVRYEVRRRFWGWEYEFRFSSSPENLREICWQLSPKEYEAVFILGGDGTLNQALPALAGRALPVFVLPCGTANDLAAELGIGIEWDLIQTLMDHRQVEAIDLVQVNGTPFATVGGTGVGALLTLQFNRLRMRSRLFNWAGRKMKSQVYTLLSVENIVCRRSYNHRLRVSSEAFQGTVKSGAIFVCNQQRLGGDMWVAPRARNMDGQFDVLIVPATTPGELLKGLTEMKLGRPPEGSIEFATRHLSLEDLDGRAIPVFGDGEPIVSHRRLDFTILPRALPVYRANLGGTA